MHLRFAAPPHHRDVVVDVVDPDATVADLAAALDPDHPIGPLVVDGRPVAAATPLDRSGIGDGAEVARPRGEVSGTAGRPAVASLTATAGFDTGRTWDLAAGRYVLGRRGGGADPGAERLDLDDPTASGRHLRIEVAADGRVTATDLGSTNGSRLGDRTLAPGTGLATGSELCVGATTLVLDRPRPPVPEPALPTGGASTRPWHRSPRPPAPTGPGSVVAPAAAEPPPAVSPVGVAALTASVAAGGIMVVVLGSWTYAAFALLGPLLVLANAVDGRRRRRRARRHGRRRRRRDLAHLDAELGERGRHEALDRARRSGGLPAAVHVARTSSDRLWARRADHPDAYVVRVGHGSVPWAPPVTGDATPEDVAEVVDRHRVLADAAIALPLEPGHPIALVGVPEATRALARAIVVQAAVAHGPADLAVAVLTDGAGAGAWDWCAWLPHAVGGDGDLLLAATPSLADAVVERVGPSPGGAGPADPPPERARVPRTLVVVDDPAALAARRSAARRTLRAGATSAVVPIVLVESGRAVPADCDVVLGVAPDGRLTGPPSMVVGAARVAAASPEVATEVARALARFDDPELPVGSRNLPARTDLDALLGPERTTPAALAARWRAAGPDPAPRAPLGLTADGPFVVDLETDGPHALVAGTTGSGKSELLRTLVAGLAAGSSPDHLAFLLIDFKGGGAFDACADLPHTTGVVTDLDAHLAQRALRCLEAELRHREARLRSAGADSLASFRSEPRDGPPLPRLVVVVDEFATVAAELPDFVPSLVGVAQRGRSLGVHLVLATQRPSGSVSDHIRANAALRIALRVQDPADSIDVIEVPDAAALPRHRPGRALVRLGPGELVPVQVALGTAAAPPAPRPPLRVRPLGLARPGHADRPSEGASPGATQLAAVVRATRAAWAALDGRPPRRPWPDPLPDEVAWPRSASAGTDAPATLELGLADHPDRQAQEPFGWDLDGGPLLVAGLPGSGTTTTAATAVLAAARRWDASCCHVHVIDLGTGDLVPLAGLPQVGAVVAADDLERQRRLLADLADDLARRRAHPEAGAPRRILVVDGLGGFRARWDDIEPTGTWDRLFDLAAHGAEAGIHVLLTADGPAAAPHRVVAACRQRLVLRLGEPADHASFGVPAAAVPALPAGRGHLADGPTLVQVARPADGLADAVARLAGGGTTLGGPRPRPIGTLPTEVDLDVLRAGAPPPPSSTGADGGLALLLGTSDVDLAAAHLVLAPGGHALVAGPPRSGRTTALATIAASALALGAGVVVVDRGRGRWPAGATVVGPDHPDLTAVLARPGPLVVVVDDADATDDEHPALRRAAHDRRPDRHVVASGRSDRLRGLYGHWLREVRADRTGVLLAPDLDLDGELVGTRLPRRWTVPVGPGRGWLAAGRPEGVVQVARTLRPLGCDTGGT